MPSENSRLWEQLAQQERAQRELEVVEAAEQVIRGYHRGILAEALTAIGGELVQAQRSLAATRGDGDPYRIVVAQEQVWDVERMAMVMQQLAREHDVACTRARAAYLAGRRQVLETIRGFRRLILRTPQPPS
jgi:hypothetical protein